MLCSAPTTAESCSNWVLGLFRSTHFSPNRIYFNSIYCISQSVLLMSLSRLPQRTWRKMWTVLFKPSSSGVGRLELYTVHDNRASPHHKTFAWQRIAPKKVVRLCDCVSVTPALEESCPPGCTALYLCTTVCTYTLASKSCQDWLVALCQLAFQVPRTSRTFVQREKGESAINIIWGIKRSTDSMAA